MKIKVSLIISIFIAYNCQITACQEIIDIGLLQETYKDLSILEQDYACTLYEKYPVLKTAPTLSPEVYKTLTPEALKESEYLLALSLKRALLHKTLCYRKSNSFTNNNYTLFEGFQLASKEIAQTIHNKNLKNSVNNIEDIFIRSKEYITIILEDATIIIEEEEKEEETQ
jgi:hypothetical protein